MNQFEEFDMVQASILENIARDKVEEFNVLKEEEMPVIRDSCELYDYESMVR